MDKVKIGFVSVVTGFGGDIVTMHLDFPNKYNCLPNVRMNVPAGEGIAFAQQAFPKTKITHVAIGDGLPVLSSVQEST